LEKYKESSHHLSYLFVLVYFSILLKATSEITLNKLKGEARERDLKRKTKVVRKEHVERERRKHV
jgi:hypothetical protein